MPRHISGLIAAPHTPFKRDGSLNLAVIERQAMLLDQNGVAGAFVCGTTGEGSSITAAERMKVAARWKDAKPSRLALIVHVGHPSLQESIALARHAARIKADAIAAIAPSFFTPSRVEELVAYCAAIAGAASGLPFYYYHMPAMTGGSFTAVSFLKLATTRMPTLAGIKFTHEDLMDFAAASTFAGDRYNVMFGRDEILLAGLSLGATCAVGSTYNFAAPLYRQIIRAFKAGDLAAARRGQLQAIAMVDTLKANGGLAAGKAAMGLIGLDCGPVRLPLRELAAEDLGRLRAGLEAAGFFDYSSRFA